MAGRVMPIVVTAGVAVLLAGAAVFTADRAGCADPGSYVRVPGGVQLVGGCLNSADLPIAPPPVLKSPAPPAKPLTDYGLGLGPVGLGPASRAP